MKIYLSQELEKGFEHWKKIFDSLEDRRQKAGIKTIIAACEVDNSNKMHCIMEIPSMETIKEYMMKPENQEAMKDAGVKQEGRIMIPLKD
tara:strand:- start:117 stop:386 length:270 start_codon:yes stop_codon:yes gene_type:complete